MSNNKTGRLRSPCFIIWPTEICWTQQQIRRTIDSLLPSQKRQNHVQQEEAGKESWKLSPLANSNPQAVEVLRVWAVPGQLQQLTLRTTWKDSGAWGLLLADVGCHAAIAYGNEGRNPAEILVRIRQL
jgi:hypothetical protein